jgi:hypothetical protein
MNKRTLDGLNQMREALSQIHVRAYDPGTGEVVVVAGNRRDISHEPEGGYVECEFVFKDGKLITAHIVEGRWN